MDKSLEQQIVELQTTFEKIKSKVKVVSGILNQELENIAYDEENYQNSLDKIKEMHFPREQIVSLNVGGKIFSTSHGTLMKFPSMLQAMFSRRHELHPKKDGTYFFDRDPKVFKYVLSYLRNGKIIWPENQRLKKLIKLEFDYFAIDYDTSPGIFEYTGDFDKKGVLYWLATDGGSSTWKNPKDSNIVNVESEQARYYRIIDNTAERYDNPLDLSLVVDYNSDPQTCITSPSSQSGFIVDLINYAVSPTVFTFSCYYSPSTYLTSLGISGSKDKTNWVTITCTEGSLNGKVKTFRVNGKTEAFRYFRLRNNTYQCLISGMEIYGEVEPIES